MSVLIALVILLSSALALAAACRVSWCSRSRLRTSMIFPLRATAVLSAMVALRGWVDTLPMPQAVLAWAATLALPVTLLCWPSSACARIPALRRRAVMYATRRSVRWE